MKNFVLFIVLIFNALSLKSQTVHQQAYWTRLYVRVKLNDKWSWQTEADNRRFFGENQQLQFIAHTHVHRKLGVIARNVATEGSLGFSFSETCQGELAVPELRPFQEFYIFQPLNSRLRLSHRIRTEQRWFHNYKNEALTEGYNFKFRFRYMLRLEYKISEKWSLKVNDELMYHPDDFDQNRIYGAVEYRFRKDLSLEMGYMKVLQKRANNKGYFDRDNLRVTVYKDFDLSNNMSTEKIK